MENTINPSIKRIIEAFEFEIDAQKAADKIGLKGADLMVQGLTDDLKDFARVNGIERCELCGEWSDDCEGTSLHDAECDECRANQNDMAATYKMLNQGR